MNGRIGGLIARNFILQSQNVLLRLSDAGVGPGHLGLEFRDLERGEGLALAHAIADIDINLPDVP